MAGSCILDGKARMSCSKFDCAPTKGKGNRYRWLSTGIVLAAAVVVAIISR